MSGRRTSHKRLWRQHGYIFFLVFGAALSGLLTASIKFLDIPEDVPLKEVWGWGEFSLWLLYAALSVLVSYGAGLGASYLATRLLGKRW
jgi:hypothetical protein